MKCIEYVLQVKSRTVEWVQNGSKCISYSCNCVAGWERGLFAAAQHHKHIRPHINSPGKDQNSDFKVWFIQNTSCFCSTLK